MSRREFTKPTKRDALKRSEHRCEATGTMYGWEEGVRCTADLAYGVEFDHIDCDANSKDNSLENCAAVCPKCHKWKTNKYDKPKIAKTNHQFDKHHGISGKKRDWPKRSMSQRTPSNVRDIWADLDAEGSEDPSATITNDHNSQRNAE